MLPELTDEMVEYIKTPGFKMVTYDPETGCKSTWTYDSLNEKLVQIMEVDNADQILLDNARIRQENTKSFKGEFHLMARIPKLAYANYLKMRGISDADFMEDRNELRKLLNCEDAKPFRVKDGRV